MADITLERSSRGDDKFVDDYSAIDEHHRDLDLGQIPSDAPGMPATIEIGVDIPPDGGYGWVCVACGFMVSFACLPCSITRALPWTRADWAED